MTDSIESMESEGDGSESFLGSEWLGEDEVPPDLPILIPPEPSVNEWEEEEGSLYGRIPPDRGDVSLSECLCQDPCPCDEDSGEDEDKCGCDGVCPCDDEESGEGRDPSECVCNPCECSPSEEKLEKEPDPSPPRLPESEPSCPTCCANNKLCICIRPEPPIDPMEDFVKKLQESLTWQQKRTCRSIFPQKPTPGVLTERKLHELLIKDIKGNFVIYLSGGQLCPNILKYRLDDTDMKTVYNVTRDLPGAISTLSLPYNNIGNAGLETLASAIQKNVSIHHLNVMNNEITGEGILYLVQKLIDREPLQVLRLSGNRIGYKGYEALSCLALSGHFPPDLDLSETDMSVEDFQVLCAALMALDHDQDVPPYYITRGMELPMDMEMLKQCKIEYNESIRKVNGMTQDKAADLYSLDSGKKWPRIDNPEKVESLPEFITPELAAKFSASVLETLFDISQREALQPRESPRAGQLLNEYSSPELAKILNDSSNEGDLDEFIAALAEERKSHPIEEKVKNYRNIPILSEDLVKIEHQKDTYHDFLQDLDNIEKFGTFEQNSKSGAPIHFHGQIIDTKESILAKDRELHKAYLASDSKIGKHGHFAIDDVTARDASKKYLKETMKEAAETVGNSKVDDNTNVVQLVLMAIVDIVHKSQEAKLAQGQTKDLCDEECKQILEEAMNQVTAILEPRIPDGAELSEEMMRLFIQSLFDTTEGTFMNLLENPFILEALRETGTLASHVQSIKLKKAELTKTYPASRDQIQYLVSKFVDGVLEEAGRLVGTGDPFNYRSLTDQAYLDHAKEPDAEIDMSPDNTDPIASFVRDMLDMGEGIALQTIVDANETQRTEKGATDAAEIFVDETYDHVQEFLTICKESEIELREDDEDSEENSNRIKKLRYAFVSRPVRLVLNRPLFHPGQVEVIAMMLGDYIKHNCSVKELHIQKWQLNETGMLAFMELTMSNRTLVTMDLSNNELGADGIKLLADFMTLNLNLKHVVLSHNRLRDAGIAHIAGAIADSRLESLNVAYNDLTEVGLDPLMTQIPSSRVNALYIWGNSFGLKTWEHHKLLLESGKIEYTDTLVQFVKGDGFMVKNSQVRDTNFRYHVPPLVHNSGDLVVPPYLQKRSKQSGGEADGDDEEEMTLAGRSFMGIGPTDSSINAGGGGDGRSRAQGGRNASARTVTIKTNHSHMNVLK